MTDGPPDTATIHISAATKRFGRKTAVDRLDLTVNTGELFAFLGPNGAGKTTTIKMIAGLLKADEGAVHVCGTPMGNDGIHVKAKLAYVPDQPFLYEKLTGREFLRFVARMYNIAPAQAEPMLADLTKLLDMTDFLDQLAEGYSHGMKQKVVLASALLHDPDLLVIDEPMVGLDPRTVRVVKDLFRQRVSRGKTVFMSTHTLEVAEAVADRIGIINHGRLVSVGTLADLRKKATQIASLEDIFLELTDYGGDPNPETIPT
jgi:ABC-2 type transport system ATP-binding protein